MSRARILVTGILFDTAAAIFAKHPSIEVIRAPGPEPWSRDVLIEKAKGVDAVISLWPQAHFVQDVIKSAGSSLRVVGVDSIGYNYLDLPYLKEHSIRLGNAGTSNIADATAEIGVFLTLAATRRVSLAQRALNSGNWKDWNGDLTFFGSATLLNKTIGVVGFGNVGFGVAKRLSGFGLGRILYHSRSQKLESETKLNGLHGAGFCIFCPTLDDMLPQSDVVVIAVDLNTSTQHLIDYRRLQLLKPTAVLVNVSRGAVIVQDDLVRSLKEGKPAAAGLDVMTPEPLPTDSELFQFPQITLLPHIGGDSSDALADAQTVAVKNVVQALVGEEMESEVKLF
ncbi:hypothetical protein M427DRAFT_112013 [Gonapodya prolifera JEL478]|uniref:Glyoxylate reductase n=1 Tax=Gonapodya prolifera (strain JEL478) TaxID=1344416 RepID=A0A139AEI0_GONPJ|nr:hypothetical protein M427DRAFT_112013 [Gonapodya prolifera JEL478]|eukprot:KXS15222.1 hypothetical protein M427DRAFT_112013 [Gonapodya prolifera JEL478]